MIARLAARVMDGAAIVLFIVMVGLVVAQVVARKAGDPLVWSEELARYIFIWVCFLGWMIASRKGTHVYIELIFNRLPPRPRALVGLAIEAGTLALAWLLLRYGLQLVINNRDVETVTLFFDYAVVYAIVPVAGLATAIVAIANVAAHLRVLAGRAAPR